MPETEKIRAELERLVPGASWPRTYPEGKVPEGYFGTLPGRVLDAVASLEDHAREASWGKTNPYTVPAGYFDRLPGIIAKKVTPAHPVMMLPRQRRLSRWSSWAAAAVITVLIALSGLLWFSRPPSHSTGPSFDQQIASLSSEAIEQYLNTSTSALNTDELLNTLNDDNLDDASSRQLSGQDLEKFLSEEIPDSLY